MSNVQMSNLGASRRRAKAPLINGHAGGKGRREGRVILGKEAEKGNLHRAESESQKGRGSVLQEVA